ncbi:hypothetical protein PSTG_01049 [Puccinia striiformis f. sp. tritici PST-78]|uniref:DNA 3'-5' helicase n=2 Tax=Puccinia striiformis f. sp. tritici TaxID=168172 RepID=A0A0L0W2B9_9BASI|nr:hypothetical protein PSTG_01049 [Puccinia striiformis f. sp. tritici PST-78]
MNQLALTNRLQKSNGRLQKSNGVTLYRKLLDKSDENLMEYIRKAAFEKYKQEPKPLQIKATFNLAKGRNTFLLAGTGYGKSRLSEMYIDLFPKSQRAVVLVLNPLDALGENQVLEKEVAGYTAINLTKMNFDDKTANAILNGDYNFIYLSPEIYLNSRSFDRVYFSTTFQNRLAMIVIDEAHMVYIWGLVESSTSKTIVSAHTKHEDYALFRPYYGKIGAHILFRNEKPLLLLSATCRPVATEAIMKCLKLNNDNLDILRGELTRPEIRIIRVEMDHSLCSSLDLLKAFPSQKDVANDDMVATLVYSGSRNRTLTSMEVFDLARGTPGDCYLPRGTGIRRFHSCTGGQDKVDCVKDFSSGKFPVISCTMALGLGQNWKRVRMVVHMGRGDPANICQMIGRCGRDGRQGLAIMFVEKTRRKGKNTVDQFTRGAVQNEHDRMDALAITPLCLRVAFSMDNLLGYIPLWEDDPAYIMEKAREEEAGMCKCMCSNCAAAESKNLMANLMTLFILVKSAILVSNTRKNAPPSGSARSQTRKDTTWSHSKRSSCLIYTNITIGALARGGALSAADIFGEEEADAIVEYLHHINHVRDVRGVIGGECFDGQAKWLFERISSFKCETQPGSGSVQRKKARMPSASDQTSVITEDPAAQVPSLLTGTNLSQGAPGRAPRPPTKKALAAEASRLRSIEKEKRVLSEQKRKAQWSQFLKEGLEQAQKEKDKNEQTNQAGGNRHESGHQQAANYNRPSPAGGSQDKGDRQAT